MKVCQLCDDSTDPSSDIGAWILGVRAFWAKRQFLETLFEHGYIVLLAASILFNYVELLRPYAAVPFVAFIVLHGLSEYIPLSPMPVNNTNAVTRTSAKYIGVMAVVTNLVLVTVFFALLMELFQPSTPEALVKRVVSVLSIAAPVVALSYLLVSRQ